MCAQGERYSFAHFVYPTHSTSLQGPLKKYPDVTFERFMVEKSKGFAYTLPKDPKVREIKRGKGEETHHHLAQMRCLHARPLAGLQKGALECDAL